MTARPLPPSSSDPCDLALDHWRRLAAAGTPSATAFAAEDCAGFVDNAFLAATGESPEGYRVLSAGATVRALLGGADPTGRAVAEVVPEAFRAGILDRLDMAARANRPLRESGNWPLGAGGEISYRAVLMPLADAAGRIDRILGAISLQIQPAEEPA